MAKDKEKKTEENPSIDTIKMLEKKFGINVCVSAEKFLADKKAIIPVSPAFDIALGGGIPEGSWVLIGADSKVGKTSLALKVCANAQRAEFGKRKVWWFSVENRHKEMYLTGTKGLMLDDDRFQIVASSEDKLMTAEDYLNGIIDVLMNEKKAIIILDSYATLVHPKEFEEGVGTSTRGGVQVLLSQFCKILAGVVPARKHIVMGITQNIANTSGYGAAKYMAGGTKIAYQADITIKGKKREFVTEDGVNIAQKVDWVVECNALGAQKGAYPHTDVVSYMRYGIGVDDVLEGIEIGSEIGLVEKSGAWYELSFMKNYVENGKYDPKDYKFQGIKKTMRYLDDNPLIVENLLKDIKKTVGL